MLFPALIALAQASAPSTTEAVWRLVRGGGYEPALRDKGGYSADLNHDGMRADAAVAKVPGDKAKGRPDAYPYLSVSMEIATPNEVDPDEADAWRKSALPLTKTGFQPHLGRTATVWRTIPLAEEASVKADLDRLWTDAKSFADRYGALFAPVREVDGTSLRFSNDARLKRADPVSLRRVFQSWGWSTPRKADIAYRGWAEPFECKGRLLWANAIRAGVDEEPRRFRVERLAEKGERTEADLSKLPEGTFYDGAFHRREDATTIDLKGGMALRDLRRRIEAFAEESKPARAVRA